MQSFKYTIKDPEGIHARPATVIVQAGKKFACQIKLRKGNTTVDAKRMFGILSLGAKQGEEVEFTFDGPDEKEASDKIIDLVKENF